MVVGLALLQAVFAGGQLVFLDGEGFLLDCVRYSNFLLESVSAAQPPFLLRLRLVSQLRHFFADYLL